MVGVPGRSKACVTCRKRRKGCDFGRPTCGQCRKHGIECGGYENQRVFVVSTQEARQPGYSVPAGSGDSTGTASERQLFYGSHSWSRPRAGRSHRNRYSHTHATSSTTNLWQLSRPEEERRCIDLFWEAYFPSGRPIPHAAIRSYTCTWTETARNTWQDEESLRCALWANSLLMAGRRHKEEWMVRESAKMYGKALSDLRKSLSMSQGVRKDASIATVKLLSMFEALIQQEQGSSLQTDWQRHNAGELALFVARRPEAHQDGDAHYIYADERVEMALSSILQRKKLVLSDPFWKSIPWQVTPKDLKDVLVDVLVDMPGLVEDFDTLIKCLCRLELTSTSSSLQQSAAISTAATLRDELLRKCWEYDRQLLDWSRLVFQLPRELPPVNSGPSELDSRNGEPRKMGCEPPPITGTFQTSQHRPNIDPEALVVQIAQVHGMSLYWTTSFVLYTILQAVSNVHLSLEPSLVEISGTLCPAMLLPGEDIPFLAGRFNPLSHANYLVDALSILLQPSAGLYGQRSAALPLEVALEFVGSFCGLNAGLVGETVSDAQIRNLHGEPLGCSQFGQSGNGISGEKILERLKKLKEQLDKGFT